MDASNEQRTPEWIETRLSEAVIGQFEAKRTIAVAAWQHMHRCSLPQSVRDTLPKHNVLIVGPTGTGKTLMLETLARIIGVPLVTFDASSVTRAGYVGAKAEQCVERLVAAAGSLERAEFGIIHLDEIDKIRRQNGQSDEVGGEAAQQAFLKILEGITLQLDGQNFSTKNILFVATGAFPDLYEKHAQDTQGGSIGFTTQRVNTAPLVEATSEQLTQFGMIPEFMRRFPSVALMQPLTVYDLEEIIRESSHSPVEQYSKLLDSMGVRTEWSDDFIQEAARRAYEKHIGASGIASVLEHAFRGFLFGLPGFLAEHSHGLALTFTSEFLDGAAPKYSFDEFAATASG